MSTAPTIESVRRRLEAQWPEGEPIDHRGWRFTTPFHCFACGLQIPAYQFAFARACGGCDVPGSRTARLSIGDMRAFAGPHEYIGASKWEISPKWLDPATAADVKRLRPMMPPRQVPRPKRGRWL